MQPIVAVIAPGMMGSAVGQRLVENGIEVRTSLAGFRVDDPLNAARVQLLAKRRRIEKELTKLGVEGYA